MEKHHSPRWLCSVLENAVKSFNDSVDRRLLFDEKVDDGKYHGSVGERTIAHRLAVHIETALSNENYPSDSVPIATDCEYNRHRGAVKIQHILAGLKQTVDDAERAVQKDANRDGWYFFSVFPDIIVHERGVDGNNLIVVELKRATNCVEEEQKYDHLKLALFTKQDYYNGFGYKFGAFIVAEDEGHEAQRRLTFNAAFFDIKLLA